ncbi:LPS-assembly protein LptD [Allostella humosa]|nr:LPS assembly protein LptD [Stella humosa]BBK31273.1 LPS-assembly protein LptD [Stella humosa]
MRPSRPIATGLAGAFCCLLAGIALLPLAAGSAVAQTPQQRTGQGITLPGAGGVKQDTTQPVLFSADELSHDNELGIIVARGKVEMTQDQRTLMADVVSYNQRTNTATASGNVSILEPTGDVIFADYVELQEGLRDGFVRNVRMLMTDGGRMAGNDATRSNGNRTELDQGVYSPCVLCKTDPTRPPMWQIRAARVIHDQERKTVQYRDATMEIMGIPVAYTPYFSHPDPTVKRQSGFLAPTVGAKTDLGVFARVPYYFVISDSMDFTFEPIVTSQQGLVVGGELRQRLRNGFYEIGASATVADRTTGTKDAPVTSTDKFRGHVKGKARIDLDDTWRAGLDLARTTDKTYMRRYGYGSEESLTTRAFVEGFRGRSYADVSAYAFQGLRPEDRASRQPVVAPVANVHYLGEPNERGAYWSADANILNLMREDGTDSRRLSINGGWQMPWQSSLGDRYTFAATMRGDAYWANDLAVDAALGDASPTRDATTARLLPQLSVNWSYPWVRNDPGVQYLIEPVAMFAASPVLGRQNSVPNEDSLGFELNDVNIMRPNRFPGLDRFDSGQRVAYGLNLGAYLPGGMSVRTFIAQSYSLQENRAMPIGSGAEDKRSDIVGRFVVSPWEYLDLLYRFRLDKDNLAARRHEIGASGGPSWLKLYGSYIFLDAPPNEPVTGKREELGLGASARISQFWSLFGQSTIDLKNGGDVLDSTLGAKYEDDCLTVVISYRRTRTQDLDIEPSDAILVRLYFKNLGEFGLPRVDFL